jgi:hypothetical protein
MQHLPFQCSYLSKNFFSYLPQDSSSELSGHQYERKLPRRRRQIYRRDLELGTPPVCFGTDYTRGSCVPIRRNLSLTIMASNCTETG